MTLVLDAPAASSGTRAPDGEQARPDAESSGRQHPELARHQAVARRPRPNEPTSARAIPTAASGAAISQ